MTHNALHLGIFITSACMFTVFMICALLFIEGKRNHEEVESRSKIQSANYWKNQADINKEYSEYTRKELDKYRTAFAPKIENEDTE